MYYGPTKGVVPWFSTALKQPMPDGLSVSDFVLDLLNADFVRSDTYTQIPHNSASSAPHGQRFIRAAVPPRSLTCASARLPVVLCSKEEEDEQEHQLKRGPSMAKVVGTGVGTMVRAASARIFKPQRTSHLMIPWVLRAVPPPWIVLYQTVAALCVLQPLPPPRRP